ncbi:MAG: hypothetical protein E5X60_13505 [Mesorhizobium sp.]|nr:MAG: hypothetical protein E5X60_13505 [Mesorhizobium sp.]
MALAMIIICAMVVCSPAFSIHRQHQKRQRPKIGNMCPGHWFLIMPLAEISKAVSSSCLTAMNR